jgi:predicted alpha/beta-hydrolase family hydrolase
MDLQYGIDTTVMTGQCNAWAHRGTIRLRFQPPPRSKKPTKVSMPHELLGTSISGEVLRVFAQVNQIENLYTETN